jgi:hypothetical protein
VGAVAATRLDAGTVKLAGSGLLGEVPPPE